MQDYKPNSHRYKEQQAGITEKKIEKVVKGTTKTKKKNGLVGLFISEEAGDIKTFLIHDVLIPTLKKAIMSSLDMFLNGGSGYSGSSANARASKISYRNYYESRNYSAETDGPKSKSRFDFDDIVYETRGDAEIVRTHMRDAIKRYGFVTVADMYDFAGLTEPYTANRYGWINIDNSDIVRISTGYIIKLPKAAVID